MCSVATVEDPAREKAERERREEARIRATEQLERRQVRSTLPPALSTAPDVDGEM